MIPKLFLAEYECVECGEAFEMINCLVPYFHAYCEECEQRTKFVSIQMKHLEWEWDAEDQL